MRSNEATPARDPLADCFALHGGRLRGFLLKLSGRRDVAEDLCQDIWLKLAHRGASDESGAQDITSFETSRQWRYLAIAGLNRYRDWLRTQRTQSIEDLASHMFPKSDSDEAAADAADLLAGTKASYERLRRLRDSMDAVFDAFTRDGSPPHQAIVFGFNRPLQWDPNAIVEQHSPKTLRWLGSQLCHDLSVAFQHSRDRVPALDRVLQARLRGPVQWEHVHAPRAGNTELQNYYRKKDQRGRAKEVTQWSLSVQRRIIKQLLAVNAAPFRKQG